MNAEEIIAEVRSIARCMEIAREHPGCVSESIKYRINELLMTAGVPLGPWADRRKYLTKPGTAIVNGKRVPMQVSRAVVDDEAAETCRAIVGHLMFADWEKLRDFGTTPEYRDWTPERAEQAIRQAAEELPKLCDRLQCLRVQTECDKNEPRNKVIYENIVGSTPELLELELKKHKNLRHLNLSLTDKGFKNAARKYAFRNNLNWRVFDEERPYPPPSEKSGC